MENKATTELLDLLWKMEKKSDEDKFDWDAYNEIEAELRKRPGFRGIIGTNDDQRDLTHAEQLEEINESIKKLERHKHDPNSGDVMVRI